MGHIPRYTILYDGAVIAWKKAKTKSPIITQYKILLINSTTRLPANITEESQLTPSFKLIGDTLKRLFQNKILMFDTLSLVFFLFAHANGNYLAKFIEFQFHVSPSKASLVSGTTRVIGNVVALIISTMVVSYFKPSARSLALYNFVADIVAVGVTVSLIFIGCGSSGDLLTPPSCINSCSCSPSLTPVCNPATNETYTSACAAGCSTFNASGNALFSGCSCVVHNFGGGGGEDLGANALGGNLGVKLVDGFCPTDCSTSLYYFMLTSFILSLILTMGKVSLLYPPSSKISELQKVGNLLVHIRCVDDEDKALGMGIQVTPFQREKIKTFPGNVHLPVCGRARGVDLRQLGRRLVHPLVLGRQLLVVQHDQP